MEKLPLNYPGLWRDALPVPREDGHKYHRGHALVVGGPLFSTGAARLAANAALRIGAGLVSVVCDKESLPVYASSLTAVMTKVAPSAEDFEQLLADSRIQSVLIGPGCGVTERTWQFALGALHAEKTTVLDADALTIFQQEPEALFQQISSPVLLTPHEGEFTRLFPYISLANRLEAAQQAAKMSNAIIILKGAQTVIASPDGNVCINQHTTSYLATAGSGDVLAGLCMGLLAQGMNPFKAACAAVWMHGDAARRFGVGLTAEDIAPLIPAVLKDLLPKNA